VPFRSYWFTHPEAASERYTNPLTSSTATPRRSGFAPICPGAVPFVTNCRMKVTLDAVVPPSWTRNSCTREL
jgi:hypothetical protein